MRPKTVPVLQHPSITSVFISLQEWNKLPPAERVNKSMAEALFLRPGRDARFFGWAHRALRRSDVPLSINANAVLLSEAVASEDPRA